MYVEYFFRILLKKITLISSILFLPSIAFLGYVHVQHLNPQMFVRSNFVLYRHGHLLRPFTTPEGRWRLPVKSEDVDARYLAFLKTYEDKRFDHHYGVDALAMMRAGTQTLINGRIVSGGSTLTMQVARLIEPRRSRSVSAKIWQMARAMSLEVQLSKADILNTYLALAPFGGNLEGIRAASLAYFGKEPRRLSVGEAALLVAIPQSPEMRRPDRAAEISLKLARDPPKPSRPPIFPQPQQLCGRRFQEFYL
jgi:penicillin-binding protein 1C